MTAGQVVIDVREPFEYELGHVDGALNVPVDSIAGSEHLMNMDRSVSIIVYCASGGRSHTAAQVLSQMGFTNVRNGINKIHVKNYLNIKPG